jgi:hypothetical protein
MSERYCILCVGDDVSGLDARAALLEEEGYSVTAASCPLIVFPSGMSQDVPNDMRKVFSSCLDKEEPMDLLLNTTRSFLTLSPELPECRVTDNDARHLYRRHGL